MSARDLICGFLESDGWREYPDQFKPHARMFCKRFDTPTRDLGNDDKEGQQVCIWVWEPMQDWAPSVEMGLHGRFADDTAIFIHNYGLRMPINEIVKLVPRLLATWEAMVNYQSTPTAEAAYPSHAVKDL